MRIVIVGPVHPLRGGIAVHGASLGAACAGRGHDVRMVSYRRMYPRALFPGRTQLAEGPPPVPLADPAPLRLIDSLDPRSWRAAGRAVAAERPDAVVLQRWHPFFSPALATLARPPRGAGARILWVVHNARPHEHRRLPWGSLLRLGFASGDVCLTHADSEARALADLGVRGDIRRLPMPAPARLARRVAPGAARRALGLPPEAVVFLFFGYVREYKGVDVLLDALARLPVEGREWHAVVAGEWYIDRGPADRAIAAPGLAGRVRLLDRYVPDDLLEELFAAATVTVLPYRSGTQSAVLPLSLAYGRPVVTTRVGGLAEAIEPGRTGELVPPGDATALASALQRIREGQRHDPVAIDAAGAPGGWGAVVDLIESAARRERI